MTTPVADPVLVPLLREDLTAADWRVPTVEQAIGPVANAALHREQAVPARRALRALRARRADDAVATLTSLLVLGDEVPAREVAHALPRLGLEGAVRLGLVETAGAGQDDAVRATVDLRPYQAEDATGEVHWWLASDLGELATGGPLAQDHVLGVGGASVTLASVTMRDPRRRTLDVGTGCGIQALHAARHSDQVVATDVSARALAFTRFNAALAAAGDRLDLRQGSMLEPADGLFDLVVSNPPFVISPPGVPRYEYRDGGDVGDRLVADLVRRVGGVLAPGGVVQMLGNWEHRSGQDWRERVGGWLDDSGLDGWVVQREVQDPAEYAETWLRDGGAPAELWDQWYEAWLDDLAGRDVAAVGFGMVVLRRPSGAAPTLRRLEHVTTPLPPAGHLAGVLAAHDWLSAHDDDALLAARLRVAPDVSEERHYLPGSADPRVVLLRQGGGFRRTVRVGTALAGVVGACDGELAVGDLVRGVAGVLDVPQGAVVAEVLPGLRDLVRDGLLLV